MIEVAIDRVLKATHGRTEHMKVYCVRERGGGGGRKGGGAQTCKGIV